MIQSKKTIDAYKRGIEDGKKGLKPTTQFQSGMERRLYKDGYRDAATGKIRH
jgi:hypothetical protein